MATDAHDPGPDMMAAELALGLLEGEERGAALRRVLADPAFAREVEDWRQRLAGLFDDYPEIAAPPSVARRLAAPPSQPGRWRVVALAIGALAAALALVFIARPLLWPAPAHQVMVASLLSSDRTGAVPAVIDIAIGEIRIGDATVAPDGKSAQLWMIGADGAPRPMGLLAASGPSRIVLSPDTRAKLKAGVTLAISIEPEGGSPTGKPTGPVVASGKLSIA